MSRRCRCCYVCVLLKTEAGSAGQRRTSVFQASAGGLVHMVNNHKQHRLVDDSKANRWAGF